MRELDLEVIHVFKEVASPKNTRGAAALRARRLTPGRGIVILLPFYTVILLPFYTVVDSPCLTLTPIRKGGRHCVGIYTVILFAVLAVKFSSQ